MRPWPTDTDLSGRMWNTVDFSCFCVKDRGTPKPQDIVSWFETNISPLNTCVLGKYYLACWKPASHLQFQSFPWSAGGHLSDWSQVPEAGQIDWQEMSCLTKTVVCLCGCPRVAGHALHTPRALRLQEIVYAFRNYSTVKSCHHIKEIKK